LAYIGNADWAAAAAGQVEPVVQLRDERRADGSHLLLWAYLDTLGRLHIDGQDLGPVTKFVSGDGEYEYFKMVAREDIPRLVEILGGEPGDEILGLLGREWTGDKSYDLETVLRDGPVEVVLGVWSG
jgi:hypothetical protein